MKSKTLVSILVGSILLNISTLNNYTVCANSELASTTDNIETIKITSESPTPLICDTSAYTVSVQRIFYEKGNECPPAENASRICVGSNDRGVGLVASYSGH